jgi:hypothetical protein
MANKARWEACELRAWALLLGAGLLLVCGEAHASVAGLGLGGGLGGLGGGALGGLVNMIKANIAQVASVAVLGIGMFLAFAKSGWMELVGSLAFVATLGIAVSWAAGQTGSFFGTGAVL